MRYAVVGLGAMGFGMIQNMRSAGLDVRGVDITPARRELFETAGGAAFERFSEIAEDTDVVFVMVNEAEHAEAALFGDAAAERMREGSIVVSTSTLPPSSIVVFTERLRAMGLDLIDSPVSGGERGAREGTLTLMLSGRASSVEKARPALDAISSTIFVVGDEPGTGSKMKVLHQLLASSHIALTVEALGLCAKSGVDPQLFYDIVTHSAGNSNLFEYFAPFLLKCDFHPYSSINTSEKDLRLVVQLAQELDFPVPIATQAYRQFREAKEAGMGTESSIATIKRFPVEWIGVASDEEREG